MKEANTTQARRGENRDQYMHIGINAALEGRSNPDRNQLEREREREASSMLRYSMLFCIII
jgi:hypothetical protein